MEQTIDVVFLCPRPAGARLFRFYVFPFQDSTQNSRIQNVLSISANLINSIVSLMMYGMD